MFYALSWFFVASLIAVWSLAAWALHAVVLWTVSNAGSLKGGASGASSVSLPEWLVPWMPVEAEQWVSQLLAGLGHVVDSLLQAAPTLAGGVTVTAWVIWSTGSVLLVLLGAGLHLLIALWRRRSGSGPGAAAGSTLTAG